MNPWWKNRGRSIPCNQVWQGIWWLFSQNKTEWLFRWTTATLLSIVFWSNISNTSYRIEPNDLGDFFSRNLFVNWNFIIIIVEVRWYISSVKTILYEFRNECFMKIYKQLCILCCEWFVAWLFWWSLLLIVHRISGNK